MKCFHKPAGKKPGDDVHHCGILSGRCSRAKGKRKGVSWCQTSGRSYRHRAENAHTLHAFINQQQTTQQNSYGKTICEQYQVRLILDQYEMAQVAKLRGQVFYENRPFARYIESFKLEYAREELKRLKRLEANVYHELGLICLVCVDRKGSIIGCIDVMRMSSSKQAYLYPHVNLNGTYISNFAVYQDKRRNGIGSRLLEAAISVHTDCEEVYAHVTAGNEAARTFYAGFGFKNIVEKKPLRVDDWILLQKTCNRALL